MSSNIRISKKDKSLTGSITLEGSKSISNRVLVINELMDHSGEVHNLSPSKDTQALQAALASTSDTIDVGHAGTSFRFLTALLSVMNRPCILTGSDRMLHRPIGALVDGLRALGAEIEYVDKEGYPPLSIVGMKDQKNATVRIDGSISSQYISALLMIAPRLTNGLRLEIEGALVSKPYIQLTLDIVTHYGITYKWEENVIEIKSQKYQPAPITVEADWSAASYYYVMAAFSEECDLTLNGLFSNSAQGDSTIATISEQFGIQTEYLDSGVRLTKSGNKPPPLFENNYITHPDIAQSVSVMMAGLGIQGLFSGVQTLKIKETDRMLALQNELAKLSVLLSPLPTQKFAKKSQEQFYLQEGKATLSDEISIATYVDHRMAMSFGTLGMLFPLIIEDADVVSKSYPQFWEHLEALGFSVEKVD